MSSIIVMQQTNSVHIITDGAIYGADGIVREIRRKAVELPLSNCVFVLRGADYPRLPLTLLLLQYDSFDAIMDNVARCVEQMVGVFDQFNDARAPIERHFELTVAGWSDNLNAWTVGVASTFEPCDPTDVQGTSFLPGYQPFIPLQAAAAYCVPAVDGMAILGRTLETQHDVDSLDPERDGLLLHKAQRLTPGFDGAFQVQYLVGGFAELVTLSAQGVSRKILCEWPDECGQLITPEGAPTREEVKVWIAEQQALAAAAEDQAEPALVAA